MPNFLRCRIAKASSPESRSRGHRPGFPTLQFFALNRGRSYCFSVSASAFPSFSYIRCIATRWGAPHFHNSPASIPLLHTPSLNGCCMSMSTDPLVCDDTASFSDIPSSSSVSACSACLRSAVSDGVPLKRCAFSLDTLVFPARLLIFRSYLVSLLLYVLIRCGGRPWRRLSLRFFLLA